MREIMRIEKDDEILQCAKLSQTMHEGLRQQLPFLEPRTFEAFAPRIGWIRDNGYILGLREGGRITAFLGGFMLEDFRNAGRGSFHPDWCHGAIHASEERGQVYRYLYRELAAHWASQGIPIHAIAVYATEKEILAALADTGFGRIVLDAARPTADLEAELSTHQAREAQIVITVTRAQEEDAGELSALEVLLAAHIGSSPVFMPNTHGSSPEEWVQWFSDKDTVSLIARGKDGKLLGFIKAEAPQFDVTFSVHSEKVLAINGMFVDPAYRGQGLGQRLLAALVDHAKRAGKAVLSVDCETTNLEAYSFWPRWFKPITYCLERRI